MKIETEALNISREYKDYIEDLENPYEFFEELINKSLKHKADYKRKQMIKDIHDIYDIFVRDTHFELDEFLSLDFIHEQLKLRGWNVAKKTVENRMYECGDFYYHRHDKKWYRETSQEKEIE